MYLLDPGERQNDDESFHISDRKEGLPKLLLVNDNSFLLGAVGDQLQEFFDVQVALNGFEAVQAIKAKPPSFYDVIVMDYNMPFMKGYSAVQQINEYLSPKQRPMASLMFS